MSETMISIAICTYNRAERLPSLIKALRQQNCEQPFEILFIDNNSTDHTAELINQSALEPGAAIRYVLEKKPGIAHARNRAIEECSRSQWMLVMDDDEMPEENWVQTAVSCFQKEGADCVGGPIKVSFMPYKRPAWLGDELLSFLGEVDHGDSPFWIEDDSTPIWTGNIAYKTTLFKEGLRFDMRYNRAGEGIGGGSDSIMFNELLKRKIKMRYCPAMKVEHCVDPFKLKRSYFLKFNFMEGFKESLYQRKSYADYRSALFGVPFFMLVYFTKQCAMTFQALLKPSQNCLRQAMDAGYALGMIAGCIHRYRESREADTLNRPLPSGEGRGEGKNHE